VLEQVVLRLRLALKAVQISHVLTLSID